MALISRGRKLVLQYTGGSPCDTKSKRRRRDDETVAIREADTSSSASQPQETGSINTGPVDYLEDDETEAEEDSSSLRRKSTTISFLCDHDPANLQPSITFVGTDPDECAYFFEARTIHACAQAEPHKPGSVGPGSIFGLILTITVLVYVLGGVFYNRTITHARGWRQIPNYSLWAGMWSFICVRSSQLKPDLPFR